MSRRQHTRVTFSVTVPLQPGVTQKQLNESFKKLVEAGHGPSSVVKLVGKETTYL